MYWPILLGARPGGDDTCRWTWSLLTWPFKIVMFRASHVCLSQVPHTQGNVSCQDLLTILRYPHKVVLNIMDCMSPFTVTVIHRSASYEDYTTETIYAKAVRLKGEGFKPGELKNKYHFPS